MRVRGFVLHESIYFWKTDLKTLFLCVFGVGSSEVPLTLNCFINSLEILFRRKAGTFQVALNIQWTNTWTVFE